MGSYETIVKLEEMRKRADEGDFLSAFKVLETLELKKIKNMSDLNLIAEVYTENEKYEAAQELYLKIYDKTKSRKSLYQLIEIQVKLNNAEDAERYLKQYQKLAPNDFYNYVFRYRIDKMKGESYEHLIEILEDLKKTEYTEKWAYELAKLYYKAGMEAECIRECSDIILWFGEGIYVEKAKILRSYYSGEADKEKIMEEIKRRAEAINSRTEKRPQTDQNNQQEQDNRPEQESQSEKQLQTEQGSQPEQDIQTDQNNQAEQNIQTQQEPQPEQYPQAEADEMEEEEAQLEGVAQAEASGTADEKLYDTAGFTLPEESEDFENGLKEDVRNILTDENEASYQYDSTYYEEEEYSYSEDSSLHTQEKTYYEVNEEVSADTVAFRRNAEDTEEEVACAAVVTPESGQAEEETEQTVYQQPVEEKPEEEKLDEEDKRLRQIARRLQINPEEIFGSFLHVPAVKKQIAKSLEAITNERSKTVMMVVTGAKGSGKTSLAKDVALFLYQTGRLKSSKVAKIKADKLNTVDILAKKETLKDCCMVVEEASELKRQTIDSLLELSGHLQGNIAFVFEEDKKNMNKLFRECPKLMDLLKNRIHLPQYNLEDLTGFACAGLKQKDYLLEPKAEQILRNKVSQIVKQTEGRKQLEQIFAMLQEIMNAADIRTGKQLSSLAAQGRLKDVEVITVLPEDLQ